MDGCGGADAASSTTVPTTSPRRIVIVGDAGAGKSTLAQSLAQRLGLTHIELDALAWDAGWQLAPPEVLRARVAAAVSDDRWVADGNYGGVRDLVWGRANTLIWLNYPILLVLWRLWWRTWRRMLRREPLWNGNRERFGTQFFSRSSLFWWVLTSYRRRRREFSALLRSPAYRHLSVFRFRHPRQAHAWLATVVEARQQGIPTT